MKSITREWVAKAEADFATAQREFVARPDPNFDAVCFHSRQSSARLLKARLQEADVTFRRNHNFSFLLDLVISVEPAWKTLRADLRLFAGKVVEYGYPGHSADESEARKALKACSKVRLVVRAALGQ